MFCDRSWSCNAVAELRIRSHNPDGEAFERSEYCSFGYCYGGRGVWGGGIISDFPMLIRQNLSNFLGLLRLFSTHCRLGFHSTRTFNWLVHIEHVIFVYYCCMSLCKRNMTMHGWDLDSPTHLQSYISGLRICFTLQGSYLYIVRCLSMAVC